MCVGLHSQTYILEGSLLMVVWREIEGGESGGRKPVRKVL